MNWSLQIARAGSAKLRFSTRDSKKNGLLGQLMRAADRGGEVLTQQARDARYRRARPFGVASEAIVRLHVAANDVPFRPTDTLMDRAHGPRSRQAYILLLCREAPDSVDEVRHQVSAVLILVEDFRPGRFHGLILLLNAVVAAATEQQCSSPR
jgi:hypothetical protein